MRHPAHEAFGGFQGRLRRFGLLEGDAGGGEAVALVGGGEQAVMADALEPRRQHMLQEAFDEHGAGDADDPLAAGFVGAHPQQHEAVPDCQDALVGNRRAVGVAGQVLQYFRRAAQRGFGIDHPVALQQFPAASGVVLGVGRRVVRDQPGPVRRVQGVEELGPEHLRQGMDREQEARVAFRPDPFAVRIQPAASHQDMDVEVEAQILGPGVQDQGERGFRAEPAGVGGEFVKRCGDAAHQRVIRPLGVKPRQAVQLVRQRKDQVRVRDRQQFGDAPPRPLVFCARLAGGAMAVAARMEDVLPVAAVVAFQHLAAQGRGAAVEHGAHDFRLRPADAVCVEVFPAEGLEDLRQGGGHRPRPQAQCSFGKAASRSSGLAVAGGRHCVEAMCK